MQPSRPTGWKGASMMERLQMRSLTTDLHQLQSINNCSWTGSFCVLHVHASVKYDGSSSRSNWAGLVAFAPYSAIAAALASSDKAAQKLWTYCRSAVLMLQLIFVVFSHLKWLLPVLCWLYLEYSAARKHLKVRWRSWETLSGQIYCQVSRWVL